MTEDEWVKKLNELVRELDEISGAVHPYVVFSLTEKMRERYLALALNTKVAPNVRGDGLGVSLSRPIPVDRRRMGWIRRCNDLGWARLALH